MESTERDIFAEARMLLKVKHLEKYKIVAHGLRAVRIEEAKEEKEHT